eukprot:GCRY01002462.1.p1 GENE.GCRY01002462.1~~GCRY01002462.1.p1  ORF type:complete len:141 (+),score=21.26 GCRY01002462.1:158-580(+)
MGIESKLIPFRFITLVCHFIAAVLVTSTKDENIKASIPLQYTSGEYSDKEDEVNTLLVFMFIFLALELLFLFFGFSLFMNFPSTLYIFLHFSAVVSLCLYSLDTWNVQSLLSIFLLSNVIPVASEVLIIIGIFGLKLKQY